uniref:Uncharacterized protein n=1 Tax=Avena sativa TaxID=4498 RepID=A0ACD5X417_AVESA
MTPAGTVMMPPCAPHLMFCRGRGRGRAHAAAAPHTVMSPPPCSSDGRLKLSDFEWVADLGEGASGVVTKVRLRGTTTTLFALKVAHYPAPDAGKDHDEVLRRATGSPHLVRCHAILRGDANQPACLLELMDAGSLARVRGALPEPALAEVATRCVAGLAHLHARGVAHLDIKPDNILATSQGDAKIGDLSVSRILPPPAACTNRSRSRVSIAVGTTAYMSPERFAPNAQAGPRGACAADIWSLGVTVLELFLGHRPILPAEERPSWKMLRDAICEGEPPSVPENAAAASEELRRFVEACLHKDPRRRATAAQLLDHPFVASRDLQASRQALREIIRDTMQA